LKLAFTTLGCPEWDLETALRRGRGLGFDGIDFRGVGPFRLDDASGKYVDVDLDITKRHEFTGDLDRTKTLIADSGLAVSALSSGVNFAPGRPQARRAAIDEGLRYIALAKELGCSTVRVFAGRFDEDKLGLEQATSEVAAGLKELAPAADDAGVTLAVETHDAWTDTRKLRGVLQAADNPAVAALWDVNHPYRFHGESPEMTWRNIGPWVSYTHFKDSVENEGGGLRHALVGEGTLPLAEFVSTLARGGYEGWYTLEWEKIWHPEIPPADVAFPRYIEAMRAIERGLD
jgi:sugar phosphate isomerase/epimerase